MAKMKPMPENGNLLKSDNTLFNMADFMEYLKNLKAGKSVTLQNVASAIGNGNSMNVAGLDTVGLQLFGTTTNAVIVFEGTVDTDPNTTKWVEIPGIKYDINYPTAKQSTITSAPNEMWQIPVKGLAQFRAKIQSIGNGNITAIGLGVA